MKKQKYLIILIIVIAILAVLFVGKSYVNQSDENIISPSQDTEIDKINEENSEAKSTSTNTDVTSKNTVNPKISVGIVKPDTGDLKQSLLSGEWYWIKTEKGLRPISPNTEIVVPKKQTDFLLTFSSDGKISIDTDCNSMSGTYKLDGIKLTFGPLVSTKMYCEGSVEEKFSESIKTGTTYYLSFDDSKSKMYIVSNETMYFVKK